MIQAVASKAILNHFFILTLNKLFLRVFYSTKYYITMSYFDNNISLIDHITKLTKLKNEIKTV